MTPLPESHVLDNLRVTPLQVLLRMDSEWQGPQVRTLLLRSGLGFHLRQSECLTGAPTCDGCRRKADCWYSFAFDTPCEILAAAGLELRGGPVSHPFYLAAAPAARGGERGLRKGEVLPCLLTLMGRPEALLLKILRALDEAGRSGRWGGHFRVQTVVSPLAPQLKRSGEGLLQAISEVEWPVWRVPETRPVNAVRMAFLSPLRLRIQGQVQQKPVFAEIARALFRRIHVLAGLYSGAGLASGWMQPLLGQAAGVLTVGAHWEYFREERTSGRQGRTIPMDGVVGELQVVGELGGLWPFLEVGQWFGVGASTGHGLGCYVLVED